MKHSGFDFTPFGVDKKLNNQEDYLHFIDAQFDFASFANVLLSCARDVFSGCAKTVAHRDLKPLWSALNITAERM